uniref:C2H2-type domain-containing protein n=1 Tax=Glossina brevipalpis TaxID=37001 RepID=A0A1A9WTE9_9MUSC
MYRCHKCCRNFETLQECLKHDLQEHCFQNKRVNSNFNSLCKGASKLLITPEKLEERAKLHECLDRCNPGEELLTIFQKLCMDNNNLKSQFEIVKTCLHSDLKQLEAEVEIHAFGSIVSKLALTACDIDVYLDIKEMQSKASEIPEKLGSTHFNKNSNAHENLFNKIYNILNGSAAFSSVCAIRGARVPIVICKHNITGFSIDINICCPNSLENTRFLQALVESDNRIHSMLLFLKIWAKHMQIKNRANVNSYCLIILAVFYLQQPLQDHDRSILLPVQIIQQNLPERIIHGINYSFDIERKENQIYLPASMTTLDLIKGFFYFYKDLNMSEHILSPYFGTYISRKDFVGDKSAFVAYKNQLISITQYLGDSAEPFQVDRCVCVQDPFNLSHNITRSMVKNNKEYFNCCLTYACTICEENSTIPIRELYEMLLYDAYKPKQAAPPIENDAYVNRLNNCDNSEQIVNKGKYYVHFTFSPSRNDIRAITGIADDQQDFLRNLPILKLWSDYCKEAIEIILSRLYYLDVSDGYLPQNEAQLCIKSWRVSGSVDLWTNRSHTRVSKQSFMDYQLAETERLYTARNQDPQYCVNIRADISLYARTGYQSLEVRLALPNDSPAETLIAKHPLRKFFNMFRCTLENFSLKEAIQSSLIAVQ